MRRASGVVLVGFGIFAVVLAILLPTWVVSESKRTPLDLDITQRAIASNAQVFNSKTGKLDTVTLRATRVVKTDSHASDDTNTTVNESLCVVIVQGSTPDCGSGATDPRVQSISYDRVTADRKSAESVHVAKYGEYIENYKVVDRNVRHAGLTYKWPIDTKKIDYKLFNTDLGADYPAKYVGTDRIDGLKVYKFVSTTGRQNKRYDGKPYLVLGALSGAYEDTVTAWIEPLTGAVIYGEEHQVQWVENPIDPAGTKVLDANFKFDKESVDFQANYSKDEITKLDWAQLWGPLILAVVAISAFVGAFLLLRSRAASGPDSVEQGRNSGPDPDDDPTQAEPPVWAGTSNP